MKRMHLSAFCLSLAVSTTSYGFDTATHAAMTAKALERSKLGQTANASPILPRLGLHDSDSVFGKEYVDIGTTLIRRKETLFEKEIIDATRAPNTGLSLQGELTIHGWVIRGVIREDDNTVENKSGPSADEPGGVFNRVLGHFYDPYHDTALSNLGLVVGTRSPDWALVDGVKIPTTVINPLGGENHYNLPSAREAMWRAVTLKRKLPNGTLEDLQPAAGTSAKAKEDERKAYWGTTFRAVGDLVHILQDAAQPQHTRNDGHSGQGCVVVPTRPGECLAGHDSVFEKYMKARTLVAKSYTIEEGFFPGVGWGVAVTSDGPQLNYGGDGVPNYDIPRFAKIRDYYSTGTGAASLSGNGLANYSSRGFYSFGTNINSKLGATFPTPSPTGVGLTDETVTSSKGLSGIPNVGKVTYKLGTVPDTLFAARTASNVRLSATSAFSRFVAQQTGVPVYKLTHDIYDAHADLLIPRAVAYSAGLIDYFFRGEMQISLPDEGLYGIIDHADPASNCKDNCGFKRIKLKVKNTTPDIVVSGGGQTAVQNMSGGTLVAVVKYSLNNCYKTDLSGEPGSPDFPYSLAGYSQCVLRNLADPIEQITVSTPQSGVFTLLKDQEKPLTFDFDTPIPINAWNVSLQVVYRGTLGDEDDAVIVATQPISAPTYVNLTNEYDYILIDAKLYTRDQVKASQALMQRLRDLAIVLPDDNCFVAQVGPLQLNDTCLKEGPTDIGWFSVTSAKGKGVEIAAAVGLPVSAYSRVAVLAERTNFQTWIEGRTSAGEVVTLVSSRNAIEYAATPNASPVIDMTQLKRSREQYRFHSSYFLYESILYNVAEPSDAEYDNRPPWRNVAPKRLTRLRFQ